MTLPQENILYKIFGIANILPGKTRRRLLLNYAYRMSFLLILLYAPRGVIKLQYNDIMNGNIVLSTKVFLETVTYWLTLYLSYASLLLRDGKMREVKATVARLEEVFAMSSAERRKQSVGLWLIILTVLSCQVTYYTLASTAWDTAVYYFFNKFTVNLMNYQLCCWLWVMRHLFQGMNERLRAAAREMKSDKAIARHMLRTLRQEVYEMRYYRDEFTEACRSWNEVYSPHIWLVVVNEVVETICSLTGLLFAAETCRNDRACIYRDSFLSIFWFCNFFVPVTLMVFSCTQVVDEAERTEDLVRDMEMESNDELLTSLLETFSLQMRLTRFSFTGFGCFKVDKTLLLTNASTALTYLIIQKQFAFDGFFASYTGF